jgi:quinoprotein glucose dehydrogenase
VWTFHTIPRKGEFGYDTWLNGSGEYRQRRGVGTTHCRSEARARVPEHRSGDQRHVWWPPAGNKLFSSSIVAVDAKTGKRVWHQQLVHHDIWDYDLPPQPILIDINVERAAESRADSGLSSSCRSRRSPTCSTAQRESRVADGRARRFARTDVKGSGRHRRNRSRPSHPHSTSKA